MSPDRNEENNPSKERRQKTPHIAIFGASGHLGYGLLNEISDAYTISAVSHQKNIPLSSENSFCGIDVTDVHAVEKIISQLKENGVDTIVNCTGITSVDSSEKERGNTEGTMYRVNVLGARNVALACHQVGMRLIHLSSRYVFNGTKNSPYTEEDATDVSFIDAPTWYGVTKALAEQEVQKAFADNSSLYTIIRLPQVQTSNSGLFFDTRKSISEGRPVIRFTDQHIAPISLKTAALAIVAIETKLQAGLSAQVYNVNAKNASTPYDISCAIARVLHREDAITLFVPSTQEQSQQTRERKVRPINTVMDIKRFQNDFGNSILNSIEEEIALFCQEV